MNLSNLNKSLFRNLPTAVRAVSLTVSLASASAATLTGVPMQGGMVMPMVAYHAEHGNLHVMLESTVPQLTPLMVSNPGDSFDPSDPWYDLLDPGRQGLAFSRRYGFVMDTMTDPLPADTEIWLRKVSGPIEVGFYRYSASAPKAWEPIFGTAGAPHALHWNGMMFHPGVTAPPGTNTLTATFEAYLVNTITGLEVPESSSGPFAFNWTLVPDGRPALDITSKIVIAWPTTGTNWVLEAADTLAASNWTRVTNTPVLVEGRPAVVLSGAEAKRFFRMTLVP